MEKLAAGQVVFWEGGSLWVFDVPGAVDAPNRNAMHAHHAFQLTFSLGGEFSLIFDDRALPGPGVIVAPDTPHAFESRGLVALLFVEPESRAGRALAQMIGGAAASTMSAAQMGAAPMEISRAMGLPDRRAALRESGMAICQRIAGHVRSTDIDRRVRRMIEWAHAHLEGAPGVQDAATSVGLSPSRASHLFVEQTGLPFRTYVLWLRLVRAADAHSRGLSLTDAAHEAGFADSAHLSRTFKRMFGLPATALGMS